MRSSMTAGGAGGPVLADMTNGGRNLLEGHGAPWRGLVLSDASTNARGLSVRLGRIVVHTHNYSRAGPGRRKCGAHGRCKRTVEWLADCAAVLPGRRMTVWRRPRYTAAAAAAGAVGTYQLSTNRYTGRGNARCPAPVLSDVQTSRGRKKGNTARWRHRTIHVCACTVQTRTDRAATLTEIAAARRRCLVVFPKPYRHKYNDGDDDDDVTIIVTHC